MATFENTVASQRRLASVSALDRRFSDYVESDVTAHYTCLSFLTRPFY